MNYNFNESPENMEDNLLYVSSMANKGIADTGTSKSVAGEFWYKNFKEIIDDDTKAKLKTYEEKRHFRFGNSIRYPSLYEAKIPFTRGGLDNYLRVSIIRANIPLLIGLNDMDKLGFVIDCERKTITTKRTGETLTLEKVNKHLALPIASMTIENEEEVLFNEDDSTKTKMKKIKKIHHLMGHPPADTLKIFYNDSPENDPLTMNMIEEVSSNCKVCT